MSEELAHAVVVDFPLQGDWWVAVNSPADRIPSHGTDLLGQRYAFDALGGGPVFARCDARDISALVDLDQDVVVETRRQQGFFELICAQIQPRSTSGLHRRYREGHAF